MASIAEIPHFQYPFRFESGKAVVVEQDSNEDIVSCVTVILVTPTGSREELIDFGSDPRVFEEQPVDTQPLIQAIARWEPRASVKMDTQPDTLDNLIAHVLANMEG